MQNRQWKSRYAATQKFTGALGLTIAALLTFGSGNASAGVGWSKCFSEVAPSLECGIVQVPLDYNDLQGAKIDIALIRLPAKDPQRRTGSIFFLPGGPGGSGFGFPIEVALGTLRYAPEILERFDLVSFDPRGIARSTELRCFGNASQWAPGLTAFSFPSTPEEETAWIAADRFLEDACAQRGGRLLDHMSTANVARDLDLMRQAVGDQKLNAIGYSYGTYIGVTYANLFPENVRAIVVDGVVDPIAWATGYNGDGTIIPFSTRLKSDVGAQATLNEFFRLCDIGGSRCAFAPNSAQRFASLAARVQVQPIQVPFPDGSVVELDYSNLIAITLSAMYGSGGTSSSWPMFAQLLADVEANVEPALLAARLEKFWEGPGYLPKRGFPRYRNYLEGFPAVSCLDTENPSSYPAWLAAGLAADAADGYFGRIWTWLSSACTAWPGVDKDRYLGPFNKNTANPVLVVGNLFDPATRYEGAVAVANLLPNSRLLTVHAWGHATIPNISSCVDEIVGRYMVDLTLPTSGTICEQDHVPFAPQ